MKRENNHKPIIETIINTTALALTAFGVQQITTSSAVWQGYLAVIFGASLEFFKYFGRKKQYW